MLTIGIAGGTGSGKTTVVNNILRELETDSVVVISQDNYYKDRKDLSFQDREKINFDHPTSIDFELLISDLKKLKEGKRIIQPVYSFVKHARTDDSIITNPKNVVIVEGILVFTEPELRDLFDLKIYVHADSDERLIRRIKRDISERGRSLDEVLNRYQQTLKPMHEQFIEPTKNYADIIIPNMKNNKAAVQMLQRFIETRIDKQKSLKKS